MLLFLADTYFRRRGYQAPLSFVKIDAMVSRTSKRLIIGSIYILIVLLIAGGSYWSKNRPICTDGIKNGQEEGVDCGKVACGKACVASVQALVIQDVQLVKTPVGDYDVAILIYNPNIDYGVVNGTYNFIIGSQSTSHEFYMLPGQTKYLVLSSLKNIPDNTTPSIAIKSVEWEKVTTIQDITFIIISEETTPEANQTIYQAVITNNTNFDFDTIDVSMVVTDSSGVIIATNITNFQTFLSRTNRSIKVVWPFMLPVGARIQTEVGTNVFNDANFIKRNGIQEKFQQYY